MYGIFDWIIILSASILDISLLFTVPNLNILCWNTAAIQSPIFYFFGAFYLPPLIYLCIAPSRSLFSISIAFLPFIPSDLSWLSFVWVESSRLSLNKPGLGMPSHILHVDLIWYGAWVMSLEFKRAANSARWWLGNWWKGCELLLRMQCTLPTLSISIHIPPRPIWAAIRPSNGRHGRRIQTRRCRQRVDCVAWHRRG